MHLTWNSSCCKKGGLLRGVTAKGVMDNNDNKPHYFLIVNWNGFKMVAFCSFNRNNNKTFYGYVAAKLGVSVNTYMVAFF